MLEPESIFRARTHGKFETSPRPGFGFEPHAFDDANRKGDDDETCYVHPTSEVIAY